MRKCFMLRSFVLGSMVLPPPAAGRIARFLGPSPAGWSRAAMGLFGSGMHKRASMDKNDTVDPARCWPYPEIGSDAPALERGGMSAKESPTNCGCPVMAFQKMISGKYKVRILWDLKDGPLRYGEIKSG